MRPERILLPLDVRKCPLEVFFVVNGFAKYPGGTVILLHVVTLNIAAPEKCVYEELAGDACWYLERLARGCLRPDISSVAHIRVGRAADEILAEAVAEHADSIMLPTYPPSLSHRLFAAILPGVIEQVSRKAPCGVIRTKVEGRFDCADVWGRSGKRMGGRFERKSPAGLLTEELHRAAA